jgi:hypothetical protein
MEQEKKPEQEIRATLSELNRKDAQKAIGKVTIAPVVVKDWKADLLKTHAGQVAIQAKVEAELQAQAREQAKVDIANRIRQLKELVHDVFVIAPRTADSVNGWRPQVRFDIYQSSKETCRKLGLAGGEQYNKVLTAVKFANASSKDYRDAIEALGL